MERIAPGDGAIHPRRMERIAPSRLPDLVPAEQPKPAPKQPDSHCENGLLVYTAAYHLKRGHCCGSRCRHCPYEPRHVEGNTGVRG